MSLFFFKQIPILAEDESVAWIFVTAIYCLENDLHKKQRRNRQSASIEEAALVEQEDHAIREFEIRDLIDDALAILSQEDRELLMERYNEGFSIE